MNRTIGGIPLIGWVLGLGAIVGGALWLKKKQAGSSTATASKTPPFTQTQEVQDFQIFSALTGAQQASDLNFLGEIAGLLGGGGSSSGSGGSGSGGGGGGGSSSTPPSTTTSTPPASAVPSPPATGIVPGGATPPNTTGTVIASGPPPGSVTAANNQQAESSYLNSVGSTAASLYQQYIATLPAGGQPGGVPLNAQQQAALNAYNQAVAANG